MKVTSSLFSVILHSGALKIQKRAPITQQFITHPAAPVRYNSALGDVNIDFFLFYFHVMRK
jgi:hypothetical protein